jgi:transposase
MTRTKFSDDFKRDAVHQITVRGYSVSEVSQRLGVSTHSLYIWVKKFSNASDVDEKTDHAAENRRLKRELARVTEERDILKKPTVYFAKDAK